MPHNDTSSTVNGAIFCTRRSASGCEIIIVFSRHTVCSVAKIHIDVMDGTSMKYNVLQQYKVVFIVKIGGVKPTKIQSRYDRQHKTTVPTRRVLDAHGRSFDMVATSSHVPTVPPSQPAMQADQPTGLARDTWWYASTLYTLPLHLLQSLTS